MQIGFNLPVSGPMAAPEVMAEVAQLGESLGFAYLTTTDHIALPDTSTPGYPYSESGKSSVVRFAVLTSIPGVGPERFGFGFPNELKSTACAKLGGLLT